MLEEQSLTAATGNAKYKGFFCGLSKDLCTRCPAKDCTCSHCDKIGHYAHVCKLKTNKKKINSSNDFKTTYSCHDNNCRYNNDFVKIQICDNEILALVDTGGVNISVYLISP